MHHPASYSGRAGRSLLLTALLGATYGCAATSEDVTASDSDLAATTGLPVMHGDSAWLECDDGTIAVNVFEHRAPDGAGRVTSANLLLGENLLSGTIDDSGSTDLRGGASVFLGSADIDYVASTLALKGALSLFGSSSSVDKTLSCTALGADFGKEGPAVPPPHGHGDSSWLVCDSATLVANVLEHRDATGTGRATSITLIAGGGSIVSGAIDRSGHVRLAGAGGSRDSFKGTASVDLDSDSLSVSLKGTYLLGGSSYGLTESLACKQLFSDQ